VSPLRHTGAVPGIHRGTAFMAQQTASLVRDLDHVRGPASASITLMHYGDFECPLSRRIVGLVDELRDGHEADVRFVYRYFPLQRVHPHAQRAAEAAEAAAAQGSFWDQHDVLYAHQLHLEPDDLMAYAGRLGLDLALFKAALDAKTYHDRVRNDKRLGIADGVRTTAALYVDGILHQGERLLARALRGVRNRLAERLPGT
jgi:protein-disulfide isomerase